MKTLAITIWALGVVVLSICGYLSWFKWRLPGWSAKRKVIEFILLFVGAGLLIAGIIIYVLLGSWNHFD